MVAKGYHQKHRIDYAETFSPDIKSQIIRIVLTITTSFALDIKQIDVNNAFLNNDLVKDVYMDQPLGFVDIYRPNLACKLNKTLYGLKQAPKAWFHKLSYALIALGFTSSKADNSMVVSFTPQRSIVLSIYVDDIVVTGSILLIFES